MTSVKAAALPDDLVCGDKPGDPKSSVFKISRSPDTTADKNGHVVDKNHCPRSKSSCERVGSTSRDATKLMDDNHVQSELAVIVAINWGALIALESPTPSSSLSAIWLSIE